MTSSTTTMFTHLLCIIYISSLSGLLIYPKPYKHHIRGFPISNQPRSIVLRMSSVLSNQPKKSGSITLIGAGPGDPDLLTIQAYKLLKAAHLVISDRLVSKEILDLIPKDTCEVNAVLVNLFLLTLA